MKAIIISGEAGSGKTTLVNQLAEHLSLKRIFGLSSDKTMFEGYEDVIIFDGANTNSESFKAWFNRIVTMQAVTISRDYAPAPTTFSIGNRLLIVVTNCDVNIERQLPNVLHFKLTK